MSWDTAEDKFRERYGHGSLCNCIRRWHGKYLVTRRSCDCGSSVMTHGKAIAQAEAEIGDLCAETQKQIVARVKELLTPNV